MKNNDLVNTIIARLILNTRRVKRLNNLIEIANDIEFLKKEFGNLIKVSELIGISSDMLNRFLSALKIEKEIKELIKERKIDSVFFVHYLNSFNRNDQLTLAKYAVKKTINSQELRVLSPLRKMHPNEKIEDLLSMVQQSKDKKIYVIEFSDSNNKIINNIRQSLRKHLLNIDFKVYKKNEIGYIEISQVGMKKIKQSIKENKTTLKKFFHKIIYD